MCDVSAQGVDERMINVHYYYYYHAIGVKTSASLWQASSYTRVTMLKRQTFGNANDQGEKLKRQSFGDENLLDCP